MAGRRAVRFGAATFALGLSLAGTGTAIACADTGDDSAAVSATADGGRDSAVRSRPRESRDPRVGARTARPAAARVPAPAEVRGSAVVPRSAEVQEQAPNPVVEVDAVQVEEPTLVDPGFDPDVDPVAGPDDDPGAVVDESIDIPVRGGETPLPWWRGADGGSVMGGPDVGEPVMWAYNTAPGTQPAVAAVPDLHQSIAGLNDSVVGLFDAVSHLLSGLPANPISDLLSGALLLIRRTVFNQVPTADPAQYATTVDGQIVGSLGAVDPEGDPLTYAVTAAPQFGSVDIDASGNFTYTPGDEFELGDTFRVALQDNGFNVLDPLRGPTEVDVVVGTPVGRSTKGFDVYNWTSQTITYVGDHGTYLINPWVFQSPDTAPSLGWQLKPGESAHFEVVFNAFQDTYSAPEFQATDGSYGRWSAALELDAFYTRDATCSDYKNTCSVSDDGTRVYFLDAPGTVIDVPAGQGQRQADVLNSLCNDKNSGMTCQFTPAKDGFKQTLTDYKFATPPLRNTSSSDATLTLSRSETVETTSSVSLTGSAKLTILEIVELGVERNSTQSWTTSTNWTYTIGVAAKPGEWAVLLTKDPIKRVTGDFRGTIGNTTWILRDVSFDTPDPDPTRPPLPESGLPPGVSDQGKPVYTAYSSPLNPSQPVPPV